MCQSGTWIFSSLQQFSARMMPAESFWMDVGVCDPLLFEVHLQCSSFVVLAPSASGWERCKFALWAREFRIAIPVPRSLAHSWVQRCRGEARGWEGTWAVPNTQPESRSWDTEGGMFYVGFALDSAGFTFQRRGIASDPPVFPQATYQTKMCLGGQDEISFMKTHIGISRFDRFTLKLFCISFPHISFPLV